MQNIWRCATWQFLLSAWIKRTQEYENVMYPSRVQFDPTELDIP